MEKKDPGGHISGRIRFPEEAKFSWLPMLLDAYAVFDEGVSVAVAREEARRKTAKLACREGCGSCCTTHKDIPVYPLELAGIYWYASEKLPPEEKTALAKRLLKNHGWEAPCPFLIEKNSCSIHPMRPAACRQFNVFGRPCAEGEDPFYTRRHDVLTPIREYAGRAFYIMLPFYGITGRQARLKAVQNNLLHTQAVNLRTYNWSNLLRVIGKSGMVL